MQSYLDLLAHIKSFGRGHDDRTGVGTISVFGYQWRHSMASGFPLLTTKKLPFRWIAEELFWFLSGSTNEKDLRAKNVDIWAEWATPEQCAKFGRKEGDLGPVYGYLWRSFPSTNGGTVDQIRALVQDIQTSPNSRRLIVTGWHPELQRQVALPPCHTLFQVKAHDEDGDAPALSLHLYARSIDSFLGLPFNIASYALLLSLLAKVTNRETRDLVISFGDLHLYRNHFEAAAAQLARSPGQLPDLHISDRLRGGGFPALLDAQYEDLQLIGYNPQPKIEAPVAV